ncbi:hypothetical protein HIM_04662 [Hirsutella minnesotensis 3608]|uniref:BTB domain-containing protein n=1 Tax=Hirsutella minnesotensis 3608 TaxID=1043627 RepID=A0A0F7ZV18_9HYPO|nr:hypothetical protein HIM_04662 [Hirsutella minnesotensis 3608]
MGGDLIQRTTSGGAVSSSVGSPSKIWRLGSRFKIAGRSTSSKDEKHGTPRQAQGEFDAHDSSIHLRSADSGSLHESQDSNCRKLQALTHRVRLISTGPSHVDAAYKEFSKHKDTCSSLCHAILLDDLPPVRNISSVGGSLTRRDSSLESPPSLRDVHDQRSSFSGRSLAEVVTAGGSRLTLGHDACLNAIREWKNCLEAMVDSFRVSLADTYKSYERDATPDMIDLLFNNKKYRREAVSRMRNASVTRVLSADPQFFPRYEIRFRNFEKVKLELVEIRHLLQSAESGIPPSWPVEELAIAPDGDAILEFANVASEGAACDPVLRFRVSSYILAKTSPIFSRMFSAGSPKLQLHEAENVEDQLPPPSTPYICKDGSEAKLFRMPQYEPNRLGSFEILLHAAHLHNDMVPRDVSFDQFVAISECCMRYKCTSPLELLVEHKWLPQWMHKGADDMPDGLLVISYAFGARQLFTRMSKSAILNLVDERDLQSKPWPQKIKEKIWAVRCAKMAQLYACCTNAVQEYVRPPSRDPGEQLPLPSPSDLRNRISMPGAAPKQGVTLSSSPRCPKGNHSCDAANLGWMMLTFNEMSVLSEVVRPAVTMHLAEAETRPRSLAQMVDLLRLMPSPAFPVHRGGVCDPSPAFRTAVSDVYNSITGLTLHDIDGRSHGWALSKHLAHEPQKVTTTGLSRMAAQDQAYTVAKELPDGVRAQILDELDEIGDLQATAQVSKDFYATYKRHEAELVRKFLRRDQASARRRAPDDSVDLKVLKTDADRMKREGAGAGADASDFNSDAVTLQSDDEDGDVEDSDDSDDEDVMSIVGALASPVHEVLYQSAGQPPQYSDNGSSPSNGRMSPATPRQMPTDQSRIPRPLAAKQPEVTTTPLGEPLMTDEEARRILWPDSLDLDPPYAVSMPPPGVEGSREKFRVGDPSFAEGLEEKTLVIIGEKQLRSDHERRIGLLKKDCGGSSARPGASCKAA